MHNYSNTTTYQPVDQRQHRAPREGFGSPEEAEPTSIVEVEPPRSTDLLERYKGYNVRYYEINGRRAVVSGKLRDERSAPIKHGFAPSDTSQTHIMVRQKDGTYRTICGAAATEIFVELLPKGVPVCQECRKMAAPVLENIIGNFGNCD